MMTEFEIEKNEIAQAERIGLGDFVIAAVVAAFTWLLMTVWEFPGLHPSVWTDAVVATGVRPPETVLPGYLRFVSGILYSCVGFGTGNHLFRIFGHLSVALIAASVYFAFREMLTFIMRARPQRSARRTFVMRFASILGSLSFVLSDPIWSAGQCFSETTILLLLTIAAIEAFFVFLRKGDLRYSYICAACSGLLAAETPVGFGLVIAFVMINQFVLKVMPVFESPFFKPALIAVGKWYMTFVFMAAILLGVAVNCATFIMHDGLAAIGETGAHVPITYLFNYWGRLSGAADPLGWLLIMSVCVAPFLVTIFRFPDAADEEKFLSYSTGFVFLVCGLISVSQFCSLSPLWFWQHCHIGSPYFLALGLFLSATTLAGSLTILGVDGLCRDHKRLARQMFGNDEMTQEEEEDVVGVHGALSTTVIRYVCIVAVPVLIFLSMLPGRQKGGTREMLSCIAEGVGEIVTESGDAAYCFTDGNLDEAIELESFNRGGGLRCLSLMPNTTKMGQYLATRGMEKDSEDMFCFGHDCGTGLRSWMRDHPAKLAKCSVLMGFDLWKRDGRAIPAIGGMLSRPVIEWNESERRAGVARAHALIDRILKLFASGADKDCTDKAIRQALDFVSWRLARSCVYRAEKLSLAGKLDEAKAETKRAEELNKHNSIYQRLVSSDARNRVTLQQRLTPREGLQMALTRADFGMGRYYAEKILGVDPENPDSNFAMGMYYQTKKQYKMAEDYLKTCLIRRPNEPAFYNNLAMIQIELGKLDAAEVNAKKALALIPESDEVKDTVRRVKEARERASGKNPDKK